MILPGNLSSVLLTLAVSVVLIGWSEGAGLTAAPNFRDFLNSELAKYKTWEEVEKYPNNFIKVLFSNTKGDWKKAKDNGVGQTTILKFLMNEL